MLSVGTSAESLFNPIAIAPTIVTVLHIVYIGFGKIIVSRIAIVIGIQFKCLIVIPSITRSVKEFREIGIDRYASRTVVSYFGIPYSTLLGSNDNNATRS